MTLVAGLAAAITVYLGFGLLLGVRPSLVRAVPRGKTTVADRCLAWLAQADAPVHPGQFAAVSVSLACVGGTVGVIVTGVAAFGLVGSVAGLVVPLALVSRRRQRLLTERQAAWPDALRDLSTHLRAGLSAHAGLCHLAEVGPLALRTSFDRYRSLAVAVDQRAALETMRAELADPVSDRIIEILLVGLDQGPAVVVDVLDDLATSATEDLRLVEEIRTAQLETKLEGRGAAALPFVVLAMLCATSGEYRAFYQSSLGWIVVCTGGLLSLTGLMVIGRLGRIRPEDRVLVGRVSR